MNVDNAQSMCSFTHWRHIRHVCSMKLHVTRKNFSVSVVCSGLRDWHRWFSWSWRSRGSLLELMQAALMRWNLGRTAVSSMCSRCDEELCWSWLGHLLKNRNHPGFCHWFSWGVSLSLWSVLANSLVLTDGMKSSACSSTRKNIDHDRSCKGNRLFVLLSSIGGVALDVSVRLIGGSGGLVRLRSPTVELKGVRGFVIRLFAARTIKREKDAWDWERKSLHYPTEQKGLL